VQEVWGYDYFGGTRTVDVHVRRLRAKLGVEYEAMIGTVRNVGYKFVRPAEVATSRRDSGRESSRGAASSSPADSEDNVADLERRFNAPS
jgi:DNA-binding winged helix-turn-helix (wHTH) protein